MTSIVGFVRIFNRFSNRFRGELIQPRRNDPRIRHNANTVKDFYCGYPYIFAIDWKCYKNEYWKQFTDKHKGFGELNQWCKDHNMEFRSDIHRVSSSPSANNYHYVFDEIGGGDCMFFAFEKSEDYSWFALKWGYIAS